MTTTDEQVEYRGKVRAHDRDTSWEAASRQTNGKREQIQRRIYAVLREYGPMTDEQIFLKIGGENYAIQRANGTLTYGMATASSVRTRRHELELLGWVTATDERRLTLAGSPSTVWRAVGDDEPAPEPRKTEPARKPPAQTQSAGAALVGLAAARRWAAWNLGNPDHADAIVRAFREPAAVNGELDAEGAPA